jgi:AraC-like DNA-binding protein
MQKRAFSKKERHQTVFAPLPAPAEDVLYLDPRSCALPYAEDFPHLHYHDRYEVGICEEGEGLFLSDGVYSPVAKGDVILLSPGVRHYSRSLSPDAPCLCRFAYLRAQTVNGILERLGQADAALRAQRLPAVLRQKEHSASTAALASLIGECGQNAPHAGEIAALRLAALLLSDRDLPALSPPPPPKPDEGVARVAEYLSLHYDRNDTARELALLCHLSESQLRRRFLDAYGTSPIAYRSRLRCNVAAELLRRTRLSVREIGERVGYPNPSDFTRAFRKLKGTPPTLFR